MMALKIKERTQHVMPYLVALTILYSIVYHVLLFQTLQKEVTEDECNEAALSGGIFPPQCFELQVFRDWHKKEAEELLAPETEVLDQPDFDEPDTLLTRPAKTLLARTGKVAMVVDEIGQTFAERISEDLAGLENKFTQLLDSSIYLDVKVDQKSQTPSKNNLLHQTEKDPSSSDRKDAPPTSWGNKLESMQEEVHKEMHAQLDRIVNSHPISSKKGHSGHKSFEEFHAELEERHRRRAENRARLVEEVAIKMDTLDKSLIDVVSDRKAWESTLLTKFDTTNLTGYANHRATKSQDSFMSKRLQWSLPAVHQKSKLSEYVEVSRKKATVVSKNEIRHLPWTGKLPKVTAIATLKGDRKHKARMMYFVDNFKLQDYEGEKELFIVYHNKDRAAAQILQRYVNDTNIKAIVAHGNSEDMFPSDPVVRYVAWSSDADIIAQWDMDEYHDPTRLSLQVRAMVYAKKHACVLSTASTSHSQEDETKELHWVSLIGEKSWMKDNWHPFSEKKAEHTGRFNSDEIVELDMQNKELMGNISRIEHIFTETTTASPVIEDANEGTDFSRGIEECLNYDSSKGHESEDVAEKAIREKAGEDVGHKFHNLVTRRRDIIMKLQLLCFQATMEKDMGKRKFMHDHVLEMDHIRAELDKHITNTASLFTGSL